MAKDEEKVRNLTSDVPTCEGEVGQGKPKHGHPPIHSPLMILYPQPGDTVSCPFTAYGTFDQGTNDAKVKMVLESDPTVVYLPKEPVVPPPDGAQWAFLFDRIPPDLYALVDHETSVVAPKKGVGPFDTFDIHHCIKVSQ